MPTYFIREHLPVFRRHLKKRRAEHRKLTVEWSLTTCAQLPLMIHGTLVNQVTLVNHVTLVRSRTVRRRRFGDGRKCLIRKKCVILKYRLDYKL